MKLYAYDKYSKALILEFDATGYDGDSIHLEEGAWFMGVNVEISSAPDLSQRLREEWRRIHISDADRMDFLEEVLAEILYGGDVL